MPFNVLLLPLLGGYIFITYWSRTRFDAKRYSGERLLLHAALAGVVLLILSYTIVRLIVIWRPELYQGWHSLVPFEHSGSSLGALLLGVTLWAPLNRIGFERKKELRRTIAKWNDYFEILLTLALDETRQVAITLKNGKVYVGFVVQTFDPAYDRKYLLLLPTMSGFRAQTTHTLQFTTDYTRVYQELIEEDERRLVRGVDDFQVLIPVAEVLSATLFDWVAYQHFNSPAPPA